MAEQSFLAKLGMRLGIAGSSAALALAAPLAAGNYDPTCHTDAARIGWYSDRTTPGAEVLGAVVGGKGGMIAYAGGQSGASAQRFVISNPSPTLFFGNGTGTPFIVINGGVATRGFNYRTADLSRWTISANATAESGGNTGTSFVIASRDDAGSAIGNIVSVSRVAGNSLTINTPLVYSPGTITTNINTIAVSTTWNSGGTTFTGYRITATDTASNANSLLGDFRIGGVSRFSVDKSSRVIHASVDDLTSSQFSLNRTFTLTGNLTDVNNAILANALSGAFTVTRLNWLECDNPTGAATVTDAAVFWFDAAAGTHKCIDAGTTKTSPGTVSAWILHNINGTIYYSNAYTSKTT